MLITLKFFMMLLYDNQNDIIQTLIKEVASNIHY